MSPRLPYFGPAYGRRSAAFGSVKRLVDVGQDVVDVLDAHRQANVVRRDARRRLLLRRQLLMCGQRRLNHERLGVADVREMRGELQRFDEAPARLRIAANAKANDGA